MALVPGMVDRPSGFDRYLQSAKLRVEDRAESIEILLEPCSREPNTDDLRVGNIPFGEPERITRHRADGVFAQPIHGLDEQVSVGAAAGEILQPIPHPDANLLSDRERPV